MWFYSEHERSAGPVTWDGLLAAVHRQELTPAGRVWTPAVDAWISARDVPWLFAPPQDAATPVDPGAWDLAVPPPLKGTRFARARAASPLVRLGLQSAAPQYRVLAFLIDSIVVTLLGVGTGALAHWYFMRKGLISPDVSLSDLMALATLVQLIVYHVAAESYWGTSIGKRLTACRVVDAGGEVPFASRIVIRAVVRALSVIGVIVVVASLENGELQSSNVGWAIISVPILLGTVMSGMVRERRAVHDFAAGTWVVRRPRTP